MKRLLLYTIVLSLVSFVILKSLPAQGYDLLIAEVKDGDIYVTDIDRNFYLPIVTTPANDFRPGWSPDGKWLNYTSYTAGGPTRIMVTDSLGRQHQFADYPPCPYVEYVTFWSPNSRYLYLWCSNQRQYVYDVREQQTITIDNFTPTSTHLDATALTPEKAFQHQLTWSPDGENMAIIYDYFEPEDRSSTKYLFVARSDGSSYKQVAEFRPTSLDIVWSSDSQWIMLSYVKTVPQSFGVSSNIEYYNLTLVAADGSSVKTLYRSLNFVRPLAWSTDDKYMYFVEGNLDSFKTSNTNNTSTLALYKIEISTWNVDFVFALPETTYAYILFSPDSQFALVQKSSGKPRRYILDVVNKSIKKLEDFEGINFQFSTDSRWLFFQMENDWYRVRLDGTDLEYITESDSIYNPRPFVEIEN